MSNFNQQRADNSRSSRFRRSRGGRNNFNNRPFRSRGRRRGKKIDKQINLDIYTQPAQKPTSVKKSSGIPFSDFNLHPRLLGVIRKRGFEEATEIQTKILPTLMEGKDVAGIAQTGGGKTGAFLIPALDNLLKSENSKSAKPTLIIAPTRELVFQIEKELFNFGMKAFGYYSLVCIGGTPMGRQIKMAKKTNQFILGTPGRLVDLVKRGVLDLSQVKTVVLDEVDRMLDMGFIEDVTWLLEQTPKTRQLAFFSATLDKKVEPVLKNLLPQDTTIVKVNLPKPSLFVEQSMIRLDRRQSKIDVLSDLLEVEGLKSIVFVNTKAETERVADELEEQGHEVHVLHGDRPQRVRTRVIGEYRRSKKGFLIATDVAARGLDIDDVKLVVNYDEPHSVDDYIHRVGRTGRAGKFGKAVTLINR